MTASFEDSPADAVMVVGASGGNAALPTAAARCAEAAAAALDSRGCGETPETGTPATRSSSPSSDRSPSPLLRGAAGSTSAAVGAPDAVVSESAVSALVSAAGVDEPCLSGEATAPVEPDKAAVPDAAPADGGVNSSDAAGDAPTTAADAAADSASGAAAVGSCSAESSAEGAAATQPLPADATEVEPTSESAPDEQSEGGAPASSHPKSAAAETVGEDGNCAVGVADARGGEATGAAAASAATVGPSPSVGALGAGSVPPSCSDRKIIQVLAASDSVYQRLLQTASGVPAILMDASGGGSTLATSVELYGSMSLDMGEGAGASPQRTWKQDWPSYYVNGQSDVDFVVRMRPGVAPQTIAQKLLKEGPWRMVGQVHVHKFASTQYTLLGSLDREDEESTEVYLDITCIENAVHFDRFKRRQEAFRNVFLEVRSRMEAHYSAQGVLAFDAYIHLLKAFAAKVPGNALTGFQATCIGLFTLQLGHFRMKLSQSIALSLFEGFLRFCTIFYGDGQRTQLGYRNCAIDLSNGGRWMPRLSANWRSEVYFMAAEEQMGTRVDERMNVAHSLDPARVSAEACTLLNRAFSGSGDQWGRPLLGAAADAA
eukprot:TRINITY_DN29715_c0_g1_i1.p1 TRINITY_DN29715_c0_g1~~TRINITY_DN29715_c0_g1_i1.p1  ORF type:complete len:602 (-),score=134.29 TRINITY_DN29715_c0_g1_i1:257-2062(-)